MIAMQTIDNYIAAGPSHTDAHGLAVILSGAWQDAPRTLGDAFELSASDATTTEAMAVYNE